MNQNNKRSRDDETNNTSNANKKSKGEDENERKDQEIERQRQQIERQQQVIEHQRQQNERHRQKSEQVRHYVQCNKLGYCAKCTQVNCMNGRHSDSLPCKHCGEDFSRGKSTLQETIDFLTNWPGEKPKVLDRNEANQWTKDVPEELWLGEIMPYFSVKELSLGGTIAKHFQKYWVTFKTERKLCVPKDFPTLSEAVRVGRIWKRRRVIVATKEAPLIIMLSGGHYILPKGRIDLDYSMTIVGAGRGKTTLFGKLKITGNQEDHVVVKDLTINSKDVEGDYAIDCKSSFLLDNVLIDSCDWGVTVSKKRTICTLLNCEIRNCKSSAILAEGGTMKVKGKTTVHGHDHQLIGYYALFVSVFNSNIQIYSPLTLASIVCTNYTTKCGKDGGKVVSVDKDGKVLEVIYEGQDESDDEDDDY